MAGSSSKGSAVADKLILCSMGGFGRLAYQESLNHMEYLRHIFYTDKLSNQ